MSLFQTLLRPDREEDPERAEVISAANLLQIGEFQLLQLAYHDWYGRDMPDTMVDQIFHLYMVQSRVPFWARHYARKVIVKAGQGRLNDTDPAFHRYDSDYFRIRPLQNVGRFCFATASIIVVILGGVLLSDLTVGLGGSTSVLPPYFEQSELDKSPATDDDGSYQRR